MSAPLRVGGRGRLADGADVTWSVAEGARGRRWRASLIDGDELRLAMLLEVDLHGRPAKLELATPAGLLTAHPEPDGVLHGNVVTTAGIGPIRLPVGADIVLDVERLPIGAAVACHRLAASVGVGEGIDLDVVRIGLDLAVRRATARVERRGSGAWAIDGDPLELDERGVPVLTGGEEWPLEDDDDGDNGAGTRAD
jgi:hypothetical protein